MKQCVHVPHYLAEFSLQRGMFDRSVDKIKTHLFVQYFFFTEHRLLSEIMWTNMIQPQSPQMTV